MALIGNKYIEALIDSVNLVSNLGTNKNFAHSTLTTSTGQLYEGSYGQWEGGPNKSYEFTSMMRSDGKLFENYRVYDSVNIGKATTATDETVGAYVILDNKTPYNLKANKWQAFVPTGVNDYMWSVQDKDETLYNVFDLVGSGSNASIRFEGGKLFDWKYKNMIASYSTSYGWTSNDCCLKIKMLDVDGNEWICRPHLLCNPYVIYNFFGKLGIDCILFTTDLDVVYPYDKDNLIVGVRDLDIYARQLFSTIGLPWCTSRAMLSRPVSEWNDPPPPPGVSNITYETASSEGQGSGVVVVQTQGEVGHKIDFTVTPDPGFKISTVYVKTADGESVPLNGSAADSTTTRTFSFPMPGKDAVIYVKYAPADESSGDGGDGERDNVTVDVPTSVPAVDLEGRMVRNYICNKPNLERLVDAMTSDDANAFSKKWNASLYSFIMGVRLYPFNLQNHDSAHVANTTSFVINGSTLPCEGFSAHYPMTGYNYTLNMGQLDVKGYYGTYADYAPYTKYTLYLPFIGFEELDPSLIVNKKLALDYAFDINTGDILARLYTVNGEDRNCILTKTGAFSAQLPLSTADTTNAINAQRNAIIKGVAGAANIAVGVGSGNPFAAAQGIGELAGAAISFSESKQSVSYSKGGNFSGLTAFYAPTKPYLYIDRPELIEPDNYSSYKGYKCMKTLKLSDLSGYAEIFDIHLDGLKLTANEMTELESLLKKGVII